MMIDLSGYSEKATLLAIIGNDERIGLVYVNEATNNSRPHLASHGFNYDWVKNDGATLNGSQIVHSIICEVNKDGCVAKPMAQHFHPGEDITAGKINKALFRSSPPADLTHELLSSLHVCIHHLSMQNAALTKIIGDSISSRGC